MLLNLNAKCQESFRHQLKWDPEVSHRVGVYEVVHLKDAGSASVSHEQNGDELKFFSHTTPLKCLSLIKK